MLFGLADVSNYSSLVPWLSTHLFLSYCCCLASPSTYQYYIAILTTLKKSSLHPAKVKCILTQRAAGFAASQIFFLAGRISKISSYASSCAPGCIAHRFTAKCTLSSFLFQESSFSLPLCSSYLWNEWCKIPKVTIISSYPLHTTSKYVRMCLGLSYLLS